MPIKRLCFYLEPFTLNHIMSHQSDLISTAINAYLAQHDCKETLRFLANDGKTALIGR